MKSHLEDVFSRSLLLATMAIGVTSIAMAVDATTFRSQLSAVPRPELPDKAANLVLIAQGQDRAHRPSSHDGIGHLVHILSKGLAAANR